MPSAQLLARRIQATQLARRRGRDADLESPIEPDIHKDFDKWNAWWEGRFNSGPLLSEAQLGNVEYWAFQASDFAVWRDAEKKRNLCKNIALFSKAVLECELAPTLSRLWTRTFPPAVKGGLIMAVWQFCAKRGSEEWDRIYASDFKLDRLVRGTGLVDLLDHFVASGQRYPDGEGFDEIISPTFDRIWSIQRDNFERLSRPARLAQYQIIIKRHEYLLGLTGLFVSFTHSALKKSFTLPFCNAAPVSLPLIDLNDDVGYPRNPYEHSGNAEDVEAHKQVIRRCVKLEKAIRPGADRQKKSWESRRPEVCCGCYRRPSQMPEAVGKSFSFTYCPKCLKVGRKIPYCSRACQLADFSSGHKRLCGKTPSELFPTPTLHTTTSAPSPPPFGALHQLHQTRRPGFEETVFTITYWVDRDVDSVEEEEKEVTLNLKVSSGDVAMDRKLRDEAHALLARLAQTRETSRNVDDVTSLALIVLSDAVSKPAEVKVLQDIIWQFVYAYGVSEKALWRVLEKKSGGKWKEPEKKAEEEEQ